MSDDYAKTAIPAASDELSLISSASDADHGRLLSFDLMLWYVPAAFLVPSSIVVLAAYRFYATIAQKPAVAD